MSLLNIGKPEKELIKKELDTSNIISSSHPVPSLSNQRFNNESNIITIRSVYSCLTIALYY